MKNSVLYFLLIQKVIWIIVNVLKLNVFELITKDQGDTLEMYSFVVMEAVAIIMNSVGGLVEGFGACS